MATVGTMCTLAQLGGGGRRKHRIQPGRPSLLVSMFLHIDLWKQPTTNCYTVDQYTASHASRYRPISELELAEVNRFVGDISRLWLI